MSERFLPIEVRIEHQKIQVANGVYVTVKHVTLVAEREVVGTPAQTYYPPTNTVVPYTPKPEDWPIIYVDKHTYDLHRGVKTLGVFVNDETLAVTTDFNTPSASGGPSYSVTDLTGLSPALSGQMLSFVGDPFSPLYVNTGSTVNGWILTDTGIYSITDIFGVSGGPTLALQHTLATATADHGFIGTQIGAQNWVMAVVEYVGSTGTKAVYTTNGGSSWNEATITAFYDTANIFGTASIPPLFMSSAQAGLAYAGAFTATGATPTGGLYKTTNYGATWAAATDIAVQFGDFNGGTFNIPWHDNGGQKLSYHAGFNKATETSYLYRTEANGTTVTDITPEGSDWGATYGFWELSVCPINRQRVALAGWQATAGVDPDKYAVFVSQDAGTTWNQVIAETTFADAFTAIVIAGDDPDVMIAWGSNGKLAYSQDFGQNWDVRTGDLSTANRIVGIIGG